MAGRFFATGGHWCWVVGFVLGLLTVGITGAQAQVGVEQWNLQVANVHNLYGVDVTITFDPAVVEVFDADMERAGIQIVPGPIFATQRHFVAYNRVIENKEGEVGTISFVVTLLNPAEPFSGEGIAAIIPYRRIDPAVEASNLFEIEQALLVSRDGRLMSVVWEGNTIRQVFRARLPLLAHQR